ncbi:MAG: polyketide cyclase [Saprospiraceae bacterium]
MTKEFKLSTIITFTFLTLGFLLLHFDLVGYGLSFFVFLPFTIGYISGKNGVKTFSFYGLGFSLITFFILLITGGLEGIVCILMALPLVLAAIGLGYLVRQLFQSEKPDNKDENILKSSVLPFCVFLLFGITEAELTKNTTAIIEVKSEIILPYSSMQVYETIKSVDTLDAEKPFLMKLDLPIPQKCILEKEAIGGLRTCYFEGGQIVERITALEKGKLLQMDVIDYQLTGRKWLGFKEAIYTFEDLGNGQSKMIRTTTYSSELYPRFYWQPLEKIGIEQEHEYVFNNLVKDLEERFE